MRPILEDLYESSTVRHFDKEAHEVIGKEGLKTEHGLGLGGSKNGMGERWSLSQSLEVLTKATGRV